MRYRNVRVVEHEAAGPRELIEDELLLAMPIVPRHEVCPEPLVATVDELPDDPAPNPFAALAALKTTKPN